VLGGVVATVAAWPRDAPYEDGSLGFTAEALSPR